MLNDFPSNIFLPRTPPRRYPFGKIEPGQLSWAKKQWIATDPDPVSESRVQSLTHSMAPSQTGWHFGSPRNGFRFGFLLAAKMLPSASTILRSLHILRIIACRLHLVSSGSWKSLKLSAQTSEALVKVKQNSCLNNGKLKPRAIETRIHLALV